jgi:hypothetical protein
VNFILEPHMNPHRGGWRVARPLAGLQSSDSTVERWASGTSGSPLVGVKGVDAHRAAPPTLVLA